MKITHVLRGQEHLMNTPKHMALQWALGFGTPRYGHMPVIFNMDGSKMSKREKDRVVRAAAQAAIQSGKLERERARTLAGASTAAALQAWLSGDTHLDSDGLLALARALHVSLPEIEIHDFRASGYLPEVLLNFIALLGWSAGDGREKFTLDEMCRLFSVERIGKTNARFDRDKLLNFNTVAIAAATPGRKLAGLRDYLTVNSQSPLAALDDSSLARLIAMNEGLRMFRDIDDKSAVLFIPDDQVEFDETAVSKVLRRGGLEVLRDIRAELAALPEWSPAALERTIRSFGEARGLGLGKVAQPLRVAVTGRTISPTIFETLAILGRERALSRIEGTLKRFLTV
jgi:glutamyl-tRNA synthetase